jgi:ribosome biogenesis GTPase / thiamine phosphate phosphatase
MPEAPLLALGWSDEIRDRYERLGVVGSTPARVARVERSRCVVVGADGLDTRVAAAPVPAVGDWVAVLDGAVAAIAARHSALSRLDPDGETVQVLAANVDLVLITAPADRLSLARVERELVVAWDSGATPWVVLTKGDLADPEVVEDLRRRVVGTEVLLTSAATGVGVDELRMALAPNRTAVLLGPSGAGKSTLANRLLGTDAQATGAVRDGDSRGRHTTTRRQLALVPGGGVIIDTPGLRGLGLTGDGSGIDAAFPDIAELATMCRFGDCSHQGEPGCAVVAAVRAGTLDEVRLLSYLKLLHETADRDRRVDPKHRKSQLAQSRAATAQSKAATRSARSAARKRPGA